MSEMLYNAIIIFVVYYPVLTSIMWVIFSITYKFRWEEKHHEVFPKHMPKVSIVIPAFNEEKTISLCLAAVAKLNYPDFEVVIINDGSRDDTVGQIIPFLRDSRFRLLDKKVNQGKAMGLNDALGILNGEVIVVLDADAEPEPDLLYHLCWHFQHARVGAVTGHPRVKNVTNLLTRIQVIEFTSIIGLLRRSQRIWGRIVTVSGIIAAFRREALYDVGGFRPDMFTEDIDITWRLEKRHWDVRYEPRAVIWMQVPDTFKGFFNQRLRWARGLMQVLNVHRLVMSKGKLRRMWPMFIEACLSTLWNTLFGLVIIIDTLGATLLDFSSVFLANTQWVVLLATFSLIQLFVGGFMENKHDKDIFFFFPYAILYPAFYWFFMTLVTWWAFPVLWRRHNSLIRWESDRG